MPFYCDYSTPSFDNHAQETRTLPRGPVETTEEWYAGQRLGIGCYVCRAWSRNHDQWFVILSRVMEKTSAWALECLHQVLKAQRWEGISTLQCWSDGPRQFKSTEYLGTHCVQ